MDFAYDDEQQALRDAVRGLVGKTYADHEHRRQATKEAPGFDEKLWARMVEMGLLGLPFAEDDGGVGAGPVEIGIVCQELGRVAAPEPYLAAVVMAGGLVAACGTSAQRSEIITPLAEGELLPALAHAEPGRRWSPDASEVTALQDGDTWTLTGTKEPVPHGARADVLVVSAALPDPSTGSGGSGGTGLFVVDPSDVAVTDYAVYDGSRAARVVLDGTAATPLGEAGRDLTPSIAVVLDLARVMSANQSLGAMRTALSATTDYLKSRKQFGVTLNTFQDLTFRAADMYVSVELTQSLVDWATMVVATGDADALADAATRASLQVSRAGRHVGQEAIQLHGGIAMTAEYSVGSLVAQLTVLDHLLGDGGHHLNRLAGGIDDYAMIDPLD
ncbi:MAG: acyl-CoA dehydrogenase family protein [Nocardioides sp.]